MMPCSAAVTDFSAVIDTGPLTATPKMPVPSTELTVPLARMLTEFASRAPRLIAEIPPPKKLASPDVAPLSTATLPSAWMVISPFGVPPPKPL